MGLSAPSIDRKHRPTGNPGRGPRADKQMARQLEYVLANSPFYQRKWAHWAKRPLTIDDWPNLPLTTRAELQADQLAHPPFGCYLATDLRQIARVHRTSGTSGRALYIALSANDVETAIETGAACFRAAGVRRDDLVIHCLGYCLWSGGVTDHLALERAGAGVIPFGTGQTTELIRAILDLRPTGIHCTPSYLAKIEQRLANEFQKSPAELNLRIGLFGGEPGLQDLAFRRRIEETWGLTAIDANFGMSEVLSIFGAECEARCGLHFMAEEHLLVELKDLNSDEVRPWEAGTVGELILTHRQRDCQPLVRYRASDVVQALDDGACECGRTSPRFRVIGRVDDMVVVRGVNVFLGSVAEIVHQHLNHLTGEFQLLVNRTPPMTDCRLRVEVRADRDPTSVACIVEEALQRALSLRVAVEAVSANTLPRTDGKTARLQRIL